MDQGLTVEQVIGIIEGTDAPFDGEKETKPKER
jgi:hypothetical protein